MLQRRLRQLSPSAHSVLQGAKEDQLGCVCWYETHYHHHYCSDQSRGLQLSW